MALANVHLVAWALIRNRFKEAQIDSAEGRKEKRKTQAWKEVRGREDYSMM